MQSSKKGNMDTNQYNSKKQLQNVNQQQKQKSGKLIKWMRITFLAILAIILILFLIPKFAELGLFNSKRIAFEPSCFADFDCDEILLNETIDSLNQRAKAMGYQSTHFRATEDYLIVSRIPQEINKEMFFENMTSVHSLEFIDSGKTYFIEDTIVQTSTDLSNVDNEIIFQTILSEEDIQNAEVKMEYGNYMVAFDFTEDATKIFSDFTSSHIGKYLCIVLDNEVISCPIINSAVTGGSGLIQGDFTYDRASELAGFLSAKPIPYELTLHE
jgi:preprotein translocase subunit SecD